MPPHLRVTTTGNTCTLSARRIGIRSKISLFSELYFSKAIFFLGEKKHGGNAAQRYAPYPVK